MLTTKIEYKKLLAKREILKLIYDMRCYQIINKEKSSIINGNSARYVFLKNSNIRTRLKKILAWLEDGIAVLHEDENEPDILYAASTFLYKNHPGETTTIRTLENDILVLELACPQMQSPIMEFISFIDSLPEDYANLNEYKTLIENMLKKIPYNFCPSVREYLNTTSTNASWYDAFFFQNPTVEVKDDEANFHDLLKSTIKEEGLERLEVIKKAIFNYTQIRPTPIATLTLKKLMLNNDDKTNTPSSRALGLIGASSRDLKPFMLEALPSVITERLASLFDVEEIQLRTRNIFETSLLLFPLDDVINIFAYVLGSLPKGDIAADFIDNYLEHIIHRKDKAEQFVEKYISYDEEYKDKKGLNYHLKPKE